MAPAEPCGSRREDELGEEEGPGETSDPEHGALLADSVGVAMLVVLETLAPAERVAFVLHDMFDVSFEEIAIIVDRTPAAARQLASRARRRVQGAPAAPDADVAAQRAVVDAFLLASRSGDIAALLALLAPDVVLRADAAAVESSAAKQAAGAPKLAAEVRGAADVADSFAGRARAARAALVDGHPGAVWAPDGRPRAVFAFTVVNDRVATIDVITEPAHVAALDVQFLDA